MTRLALRTPFPLLLKELTEQAARRRTYVVRVVYALAMGAVFLMAFYDRLGVRIRPGTQLGVGREMLWVLVLAQFCGILLFLPALMSGALTAEKERGSLPLLFLTSLRPWELVVQKYVGRLLPVFSLLALSLPLMAVCYAFGGITSDQLVSGVACLVVLCLQAGALSLLCSAFCATSLGALLLSYALVLFLHGGSLWFGMVMPRLTLWKLAKYVGVLPGFIMRGTANAGPLAIFTRSIPALIFTVVLLLLARLFVVRRAFVQPRNPMQWFFRWLDRVFVSVNTWFGGVEFGEEQERLPGDEPIAWRELTKRSLGRFSHTLRIVLVLEAAVLIPASLATSSELRSGSFGLETLTVVFWVLWLVAAVSVSIRSATVIASERANRTLDTLLTTPVATADLVRQKLQGVRRLIRIFAVPFVTILLFRFALVCTVGQGTYTAWGRLQTPSLVGVALQVMSVFFFLSLLSWVSAWIGMRARTHHRAVIAVLVVLTLWNAVPVVFFGWLGSGGGAELILTVAPCAVIGTTDLAVWRQGAQGEVFLVCIVGHVVLSLLWSLTLRACLYGSDRHLGRSRARAWMGNPSSFLYVPDSDGAQPSRGLEANA